VPGAEVGDYGAGAEAGDLSGLPVREGAPGGFIAGKALRERTDRWKRTHERQSPAWNAVSAAWKRLASEATLSAGVGIRGAAVALAAPASSPLAARTAATAVERPLW
jgi:hypothetical protein